MGLFGGNKNILIHLYPRLGMEWRTLRNVYKNSIAEVSEQDSKIFIEIGLICDQIDQEIQKGTNRFGAPNPNKESINAHMVEILELKSRINNLPPKANRTERLILITVSIFANNFEGLYRDADGYHPDWYKGL
jgi:hypothetical protein